MRRESIRLRSLAKYGDKEAKLKLGEAYLSGLWGFSKDIPVGLEYLQSLMPHEARRICTVIAKSLSLEEILSFQQIKMIELAAAFDEDARLKYAAWLLIQGETSQAFNWLEKNDKATGERVKSFLGAITARNVLGALRKLFTNRFWLCRSDARTKTAPALGNWARPAGTARGQLPGFAGALRPLQTHQPHTSHQLVPCHPQV
jgi:hypothetical protein